MREYETDRASLVGLIGDLMKQLPVGKEVVVPPDVARCMEEFRNVQEGGIVISITPSSTAKSSTPSQTM